MNQNDRCRPHAEPPRRCGSADARGPQCRRKRFAAGRPIDKFHDAAGEVRSRALPASPPWRRRLPPPPQTGLGVDQPSPPALVQGVARQRPRPRLRHGRRSRGNAKSRQSGLSSVAMIVDPRNPGADHPHWRCVVHKSHYPEALRYRSGVIGGSPAGALEYLPVARGSTCQHHPRDPCRRRGRLGPGTAADGIPASGVRLTRRSGRYRGWTLATRARA